MSQRRIGAEDIGQLLGALLQASVMLIGAAALGWGLISWLFR